MTDKIPFDWELYHTGEYLIYVKGKRCDYSVFKLILHPFLEDIILCFYDDNTKEPVAFYKEDGSHCICRTMKLFMVKKDAEHND